MLLSCCCPQAWLGTPCIYVLDCSAAGFIINSFKTMMDTRQQQILLQQQAAAAAGGGGGGGGAADPAALNGGMLGGLPSMGDPMKEVIVLAACGGNELLPQVGGDSIWA
jgi:regulator-associated protein of mTOR